MVLVENAVIARLNRQGHHFEILVDCPLAVALREGKSVEIHDILAAPGIFADARKGLAASGNAIKSIFGSSDTNEVAKEIILKGDLQLTQEYREQLREEKRKQLIAILHRNGVDPKNHLPHPPQRIESALEEAKFHVDELKPVNDQVQEALKKLRPILPIKFEIKEIGLKITPEYAPKCYATIKQFGTILKEEWQNNGYWVAVVEIPGGLEADMFDRLNKIAHGNIESKVVKVK